MHKIKRPQVYLVLLLTLFIHLTVLDYIKIFGAKPDILLLFVVFFGLFLGPRMGLEAGLAAGFLEDIFTIDIFWVNTFILGVTGLLVGVLKMKFFKESKMTQVLLVFAFTIVAMWLRFVNASFFMKSVKMGFSEYLFNSVMPTSIYTAVISIPLFSRFINLYNLREEDEDLL